MLVLDEHQYMLSDRRTQQRCVQQILRNVLHGKLMLVFDRALQLEQ